MQTTTSNGSEEIQQNRESEAAESSRKANGKAKVSSNDGKRKTKPPLNSLAILHDAEEPIDKSSLDKLCQQLYAGVFLKRKKLKYIVDNKFNKNGFEIFARELKINGSETAHWWKWYPDNNSSGEDIEVAELVEMSWLEIKGKIWTVDLSPGTLYEIVFVVKLGKGNGNGNMQEFSVKLVITYPNFEFQKRIESLKEKPLDKWIEIWVGDFKTSPEIVGHLKFTLVATDQRWKHGLVVQCAIIRPKD